MSAGARYLDLQANDCAAPALAAQVGFKSGKKLTDFGGRRIVLQNQTPIRSFDRAGLHTGTQSSGDQRFDGFESGRGVPGQLRQQRQRGRILTGLQQANRGVATIHELGVGS